MHKSVGEIIDVLGGTRAVAEALGLNLSTVSSWKTGDRNSIPSARWLEIVKLARARKVKGITVQRLAALHTRPSPATVEASP